jgi:hypothetical protein
MDEIDAAAIDVAQLSRPATNPRKKARSTPYVQSSSAATPEQQLEAVSSTGDARLNSKGEENIYAQGQNMRMRWEQHLLEARRLLCGSYWTTE